MSANALANALEKGQLLIPAVADMLHLGLEYLKHITRPLCISKMDNCSITLLAY